MLKLARKVAQELETRDHCVVYQAEMTRGWPSIKDREEGIRKFAEKYGWRIRFYKDGMAAIFEKAPPVETQ